MHVAARFASKEFVSLLLNAGALITRNTIGYTPKDCALKARRFDIVSMFETTNNHKRASRYEMDSVILNGSEVSSEKIKTYKELLRNLLQKADNLSESAINEIKPESTIFRSIGRSASRSILPTVDKQEENRRNKLLLSIVNINRTLIKGYAKNRPNTWWGFIRIPEQESANGSWKNYYCCIDHTQISLFKNSKDSNTPIQTMNYSNILSFRIYLHIPSRFSILFQGSTEVKNLAAKSDQVFSILQGTNSIISYFLVCLVIF